MQRTRPNESWETEVSMGQKEGISRQAGRVWKWVSSRSPRQALLWGVLLAVAFEAFTCLLRFGLGLQSAQDASWVAYITFGYRVHHGFIGVALIALAPMWPRPGFRNLLIALGVGLALSDVMHHTLLWLLTGSAEFDLVYPSRSLRESGMWWSHSSEGAG